ncbi:O-antigen ligase family protein [Paenibacillus humicus]|uniref:O-antigen ligase family protein n=1 Tax=Paenibacillus humicus TaxID=412861 RepID=UPI003D299178
MGKGGGKDGMDATGLKGEEAVKDRIGVLAAIACIAAGCAACMSQGLYFKDTRTALGLMTWGTAITGIIVAVLAARGRRTGRAITVLISGGGRKAERFGSFPMAHHPLELRHAVLLAAAPSMIALLYAAHLLAGPLSVQSTGEAVLGWSFYGCFGIAAYYAARSAEGRKLLQAGWSIIGLVLGVTGLASVYGLFPYPGAIFRTDETDLAAGGARLGGLLQYPNAFGAVMGAYLLERLMLLARLRAADFTRGCHWRGYIVSGSAFIYMLCLLLTESRGASLATAAAGIAGLCRLRPADRLRFAKQSGLLLLCGALAAGPLAASSLAPPLLPGLVLLGGTSGAAIVAAKYLAGLGRCKKQGNVHKRRHGYRNRSRFLPAGGVLLTAALLGAVLSPGLVERSSRLTTASARIQMYRDGGSLFLLSPWSGQGGKTWEASFRSIQSSPYVGEEVHRGYLNIALDTGLLGLAITLLWLGAIGAALARARSRMLPPFLAVLLHSAADFDMSYGLTWLLIIWMAAAGITRKPGGAAKPAFPPALRLLPRGSLIALAGLLLLASATGARQAVSLSRERQALAAAASGNIGQATALLEQALALCPARTSARLHLASLSGAAAQAGMLRQGLAYDRADPELWAALGQALSGSRPMEAVAAWEQAVQLDLYSRQRQTEALSALASLAGRLREHYPQEAGAAAAAGYKLYVRYEELARRLASTANLRNDRRFTVTAEAKDRGRELGEYVLRYSPVLR